MDRITLADVPISVINDIKDSEHDDWDAAYKVEVDVKCPSRFRPLATRPPDLRGKILRDSRDFALNCRCFGCESLPQQWRLNLTAVDHRFEHCIERDKLFKNMQSLRMERSLIHGWGLFATRQIAAHEPVIEYTGEIIRLAIVDKRQELYEQMGNLGSYIFRLENGDSYIDATIDGGPAKYINCSCDPNCETKCMRFDGMSHVVIYSVRDISAGEELSYDYKLDYEPKEKRIQCTCGAKKCKGWLNWNEREHQALAALPAVYSLRRSVSAPVPEVPPKSDKS